MKVTRLRVIAAIATALAALVAASVAFGFASSLGVLSDSNTVNTVNFNDNPIKLRTKDPIRVRVVHTVAASGFTSGWHVHPGPAIVAVTRGSFQIFQFGCEPTIVSAGQAYIETPGVPVNAVAVGETEWTTTLLLPIGAPPATPVDSPC